MICADYIVKVKVKCYISFSNQREKGREMLKALVQSVLLDSRNLHSHFGSFLDLDLVLQLFYMIEQNINA